TCPFAARCEWAVDHCRSEAPKLAQIGEGRASACWRTHEIRDAMRSKLIAAPPLLTAAVRSETPLVRVEEATKVFGNYAFRGRGQCVKALDRVSLTIGAGESVGLVGESGSGKTTLARCLV